MKAEVHENHRWLAQLVGDWSYESEAQMGPGKPPAKVSGTESVRALGEVWILGESQSGMPGGGTAQMLITLGYDPLSGRFVGSWIGSMMTQFWVYDGELDAARKVLTLSAEGPDMSNPGSNTRFQDIIELVDSDHRILRSRMLGSDGQWHEFMVAHFRRIK